MPLSHIYPYYYSQRGRGYSPFVLEDSEGVYTGFWNDDAFWNDSSTWTELSYNENYQDVLAEARRQSYTLPSDAQKQKDSDFLDDISSIWTKVKGMKMFKADAARSDGFALLDWVNPLDNSGTLINSPTKDANGFYSNGTNSYVNSGITLDVITQNSFCAFAKGINNSALGASILFGASNGGAGSSGAIYINPRNASDAFTFQAASTAAASVASTTDARNRLCIGRDTVNHFRSINGAAKTSSADTYSPVDDATTKTFALLADNGLSVTGFNTRGISYFIVTDLLTDGEIATMDTALTTWLS